MSADAELFLDDESKTAVDWDAVWDMFAPMTPYGKRWKLEARAFVTGEEAACAAALALLRQDANQLNEPDCRCISDGLRALPDIYDALSTLFSSGSVLSPRQLLALKQFAKRGLELAMDERLARLGHAAWTNPSYWKQVLEPFGETERPTFSIDHVANHAHRDCTQAYAAAMRAVYAAKKERDAYWVHRTGQRPTREGQLILPVPLHKCLADELKAEGRLVWLRDTPFEVVFSMPDTEEMNQAQCRVDEAKARLEAVESELLRGLCDALRNDAQTWRRLTKDVADVDVRIAKVKLLHQWAGVVPCIGEGIEIRQAVHPLVEARLRMSNRSYVPLDVGVAFGANVICGSNMGGKTVAMSLFFLCQSLAQYAMPVPAQSFTTQLFRVLRFCASAETELHNGLSSFGREVVRLTAVWRDFTEGAPALLCLDEPGRSTNPLEGEAMTVSVIRNAVRRSAQKNVLFVATHFSAVMREGDVWLFRVRGLTSARLEEHQGEGAREEDRKEERVHPVDGTVRGLRDTTAQRIRELEQHMDYRVERVHHPGDIQEALSIGKWLGLPEELLVESYQFIERGERDEVKAESGSADDPSRTASSESNRGRGH